MKMGSVIVEKEKKVLTMTEYIEREAISEEIRKYYYKNPPNFSYGEGFDRGLDRAQRAILDAPVADVAPVRHGRWVDRIVDENEVIQPWMERYYCSECLEGGNQSWFKFCPNCGVKMDGGDGNSDMA